MIKPMDVTPEISEALAVLRQAAMHRVHGMPSEFRDAINVLDNAGVFAEIDERNDYASAEEILAEAAVEGLEQKSGRWAQAPLDPAEWGDTTREDQARHQGLDTNREQILIRRAFGR